MLDTLFEAPRKRPTGVTAIAVLVSIQGIFNVLVGIFFLLGALLGGWVLTTSSVILGFLAGVLVLLLGLALIYMSWGLWTLKRWAYWTAVILLAFDLLVSLFGLTLPISGVWTIWGGIVLPAVVLIYFLAAPSARKAFRG
ncbi:MAG TPA: hypothetical protein VF026_22110 [Ktedonobacteraceae bacterium]